jgi:hypothetical protein
MVTIRPFCLSTLVVTQCLTTALTLSPAPVDGQGDLHIIKNVRSLIPARHKKPRVRLDDFNFSHSGHAYRYSQSQQVQSQTHRLSLAARALGSHRTVLVLLYSDNKATSTNITGQLTNDMAPNKISRLSVVISCLYNHCHVISRQQRTVKSKFF